MGTCVSKDKNDFEYQLITNNQTQHKHKDNFKINEFSPKFRILYKNLSIDESNTRKERVTSPSSMGQI
jgi:hypothetical protein